MARIHVLARAAHKTRKEADPLFSDERSRTERFERIFVPHLDAAYDFARWLSRDERNAEDICQEACPWNQAPPSTHPAFAPRESYRATPITDLLRFTQAEFSALFTKSAVKRAKLAGMIRNVEALEK